MSTATTEAERLRAELAEAVAEFNDNPPLNAVANLLAVDEIGRLRVALREAEGRAL